MHLDSSSAAIALLWARRSGVKPDGDCASSPRRRPKCFRRENLHGIEAKKRFLNRSDEATASSASDPRNLAAAKVLEGFGACLDGDGDGATGNTTPHFFAACALRTARTKKACIRSIASLQRPRRRAHKAPAAASVLVEVETGDSVAVAGGAASNSKF